MANLSLLQSSLTGGELSPSMYARVDVQRYQASVALLRNFIVRHWGGVDNRPGTGYVGTTKGSANNQNGRLIPFIFNSSQAYVLEFGQNSVRFIKNGGYIQQVLANCPAYDATVTYVPGNWVQSGGVMYYCIQRSTGNAPASSPTFFAAQTVYEIYSPYAFSDLAALKFTQSADVMTLAHIGYPTQQLSRLGDNIWTLSAFAYFNGPFQQTNTVESTTVTASATTGSITLTASAPIFNANHVGALFKIAEQDLSGIPPWESDKSIATGTNSPLGLLRRNNGNVYKCTTSGNPGTGNPEWRTGIIPPTHTFGTQEDGDGGQIVSTSGSVVCSKAGMAWQYLHSQYGVALITAYTDSQHVTAFVVSAEDNTPGYMPDSIVSTATSTVEFNSGVNNTQSVFTLSPFVADANPYNYVCVISTVGSSTKTISPTQYSLSANGQTITFQSPPNIMDVNKDLVITHNVNTGTPSFLWAFGSWSADAGYPSTAAYMGDRLCLAGSANEPQRVWGSKVSQYTDFGEGNPIVDSDAIAVTVNSRKINTIQDMVPLNNLMLLTQGGEFALFGDQDGLLAPSTIKVKGQSYHGIGTVRAHAIGNAAVFIQARGYAVRDLTYSLQLNAYTGDDLTQFASHLTLGYTLVDMDYSELPYSCLWFVRSDGELLSMTYMKEQGIVAWARHDTLNGAFENVCVIPEGNEDVPYFIVRRVINGQTVRYVERLHTRRFLSNGVDVPDAKWGVFLDASLSYDGTNYNAAYNMTLTGGTNWNKEENLTATAAGGTTPFTAGSVGGSIVLTGADGSTVTVSIIAYTSSTVVTVRPLANVPASLQGTATSTYGIGQTSFTGLSHLIGQTVGVLADGGTQATPIVVSNSGGITLENPAVVVCAGLKITSQLQTLEITYPYGETVSAKSLRAVYKAIPRLKVVVANTRGLWAGTKFTDLYEMKQRWQEPMGQEMSLFTGTQEINTDTTNDLSAQVCFQVTDPVPCSILGIIPELAPGQ